MAEEMRKKSGMTELEGTGFTGTTLSIEAVLPCTEARRTAQ